MFPQRANECSSVLDHSPGVWKIMDSQHSQRKGFSKTGNKGAREVGVRKRTPIDNSLEFSSRYLQTFSSMLSPLLLLLNAVIQLLSEHLSFVFTNKFICECFSYMFFNSNLKSNYLAIVVKSMECVR